MKKIIKPLLITGLVLTVAAIGLAVFVRLYLTDQRIKSLIVPPAEKALGRSVTLGDIEVGILSGITVNDLLVKETDKKNDFVKISRFRLRYDLLPLLKKELVINQVLLTEPTITISRDRQGRFNFDSLALLAAPAAAGTKAKPSAGTKPTEPLPVTLTVQQVKIEQARLTVRDATGVIPTTTILADLEVALSMAADSTLTYQGELKAVADAVHGGIKSHATLTGRFDHRDLSCTIDLILEEQQVQLTGIVKNYAGRPSVQLDLHSKELALDKLAALGSKLPAGKSAPQKQKAAPSSSATAKGEPAPPVQGRISIDRATHGALAVNGFTVDYLFSNNILELKDLAAKLAGGGVNGQARLDLNPRRPAYQGKLAVSSVGLDELLKALAPKVAGTLSGKASTAMTFSGAGFEWEQMRDSLNANGTFNLSDGVFHNTPMTLAVAELLDLKELKEIRFKEAGGDFEIRNGKARLAAAISGTDVSASGTGTIGLDSSLDFPVTLRFSPNLSAKLRKRASFTRYLSDEGGKTSLHLKVRGTVQKPRPSLDTRQLGKQAEEQLKQKAREKTQKELQRAFRKHIDKEGDSTEIEKMADDLLKNIFGK